jgi:phosphatase NudJ
MNTRSFLGSTASPIWLIALVVVKQGDRFVLINEKKDRGWYLPAGRVDPGESLEEGARRETLEESGLEVELDGILRMEFTPGRSGREARLRVIFLAHPTGGSLKSEPDEESLGAAWVTLADLEKLRLRAPEVVTHLRYVAGGGPILPLSTLTWEGAPYDR